MMKSYSGKSGGTVKFPRAAAALLSLLVFLPAIVSASGKSESKENTAGGLQEVILPAEGTAGEAFAVLFKLTAPADDISVKLKNESGEILTAGKGFSLQSGETQNGGKRYIYAALIGLSIFLEDGIYRLEYSLASNGSETAGCTELRVSAPEWNTEKIALDERNTAVRTNWGEERKAQIAKLNGILFSCDENAARFAGRYIKPVDSNRITSYFGDRRVFLYSDGGSDASAHYGVDFGVPTGTEVVAAGGGRVVMAENRISTGWSVVIEHMPGLFSLYYHLNEMNCSVGDTVEPGDLIGKSGATGLATGPHLHWEFRVNGEAVSPWFFLEKGIFLPVTPVDTVQSAVN